MTSARGGLQPCVCLCLSELLWFFFLGNHLQGLKICLCMVCLKCMTCVA